MPASLVRAFDQPVEIRDLPVPELGPGQVLVRSEASGLCHTGIHTTRGEWPIKPFLPFTPDREGVGIIELIGMAVTERSRRTRAYVGADLAEVFCLHAAGRTTVQYEIRKLEEINQAFEDVLAGRIAARLVFEL